MEDVDREFEEMSHQGMKDVMALWQKTHTTLMSRAVNGSDAQTDRRTALVLEHSIMLAGSILTSSILTAVQGRAKLANDFWDEIIMRDKHRQATAELANGTSDIQVTTIGRDGKEVPFNLRNHLRPAQDSGRASEIGGGQ